jgi:phosphoribosylaminoimidazole-succinocarboxamide synthase
METVVSTHLPNPLHQGKVRDTYALGNGLLLMVATDRISAFDVVLPTAIPEKGVVLAQLSAFWFRKTQGMIPNHLVGMANDPGTPGIALLDPLPPEIARRSMVVRQAQRIDVECIARGYLTGSAWVEYQKWGTVHDQPMPKGLRDGDAFSEPIFTPTTKAETGHDEPLSLSQLENQIGSELALQLQHQTIAVYCAGRDYALQKGVLIADTKLEFGLIDGVLTIIDELLTPDSSRFWDASAHSPGRSQPNYDKQFVRDWLIQAKWDKEPPAPELPQAIVEKTRERYAQAYKLLTGEFLP